MKNIHFHQLIPLFSHIYIKINKYNVSESLDRVERLDISGNIYGVQPHKFLGLYLFAGLLFIFNKLNTSSTIY